MTRSGRQPPMPMTSAPLSSRRVLDLYRRVASCAGRRIAELDPRWRVIARVLDAANVTINAGSL